MGGCCCCAVTVAVCSRHQRDGHRRRPHRQRRPLQRRSSALPQFDAATARGNSLRRSYVDLLFEGRRRWRRQRNLRAVLWDKLIGRVLSSQQPRQEEKEEAEEGVRVPQQSATLAC